MIVIDTISCNCQKRYADLVLCFDRVPAVFADCKITNGRGVAFYPTYYYLSERSYMAQPTAGF